MILASSSPRRKEILKNAGFQFTVVSKDVPEISNRKTIPERITEIADKKCLAVATEFPDEYVLAADTVVVLDNQIIGKPKNAKDASLMLRALSGKQHTVLTAYSLHHIKKNIHLQNYQTTTVQFKHLNNEDIVWYISTKEPLDKAGAYGAQEKGAMLIEKIEGDFFTVMGFPLALFIEDLKKAGKTIEEILTM
jgi:septum formation protein